MRRRHATAFALLLGALLLPAASPPPAGDADTVIIVVRHAERDDSAGGEDPPLSAAGVDRAAALRDALGHAGVGTILVSNRRRTAQTAAPLAEALHLTPIVAPIDAPADAYARALAERARREHRGQVVLIVNHSNTVPLIVRALGGTAADIPDHQFDDLYVMTITAAGTVRSIRARYGRTSDAGETGA
jgi:broad specificity phosphatase PhoE